MATVTVHVPDPLRAFVGERPRVRVEAATLDEALERLTRNHPLLHGHLYGDDGRLRPHVNLFLDGRDVRELSGDRPLEGEPELRIVPSIRGGSPAAESSG